MQPLEFFMTQCSCQSEDSRACFKLFYFIFFSYVCLGFEAVISQHFCILNALVKLLTPQKSFRVGKMLHGTL